MPFRFSLDSLLRFRHSVEHQQELRLQVANQQVGYLQRRLEQVDQALLQAHLLRSRHLLAGETSAELRFELDAERVLQQNRNLVQKELSHRIELRNQQLKLFQQSRREREILEGLRNQQLRDYTRNSKRAEQRRLDDLFLLRRSYLERE